MATVVQTSEEDAALTVVRFASELAWADAGPETAEPQVNRLCVEAQECMVMGRWLDLASLMLTSADLIFSKVSEKDLECVFTIICNLVTKAGSPDESLEMAKLISAKICQQPNDKPALRLKILFNLYNLLENPYSRFHVYMKALDLAFKGKAPEHIIPTLKKIESFLREWNIGIVEQRELFLAISNVLKESKSSANDYFKFLTKYLATFSGEDASTLSEAKEEAVHAIVEFVKAPNMFKCDLLDMPAVGQLEKDAKYSLVYQLLKIFLTQRLDAYMEFQAANSSLLKSYGLVHEDCIAKMRGEDDYMPGSIIEIELHNFMTFNHLKCKPGSRLNLVIGPNGSGKSSIVCAIALGLGGEPQLLGRATSVGAYVKRGEESGYVRITLRGNTKEEKITITRKMDTHNKSEWLFNGKVVPKKDVAGVIQRFNIQVNNLTQFLPQDRVCEFAKLTPVQLLEETEKAVGDPQLPILHRALVDKSHGIKSIERAVEKNGETLDQLKALNVEQEKDVEHVRQRDELLKKVESMKKKLPWLKYDMKKAEYLEVKEKEKEAKKKLDEAANTLNDLKEPIEKQKMEKAKLDAKTKKYSTRINDNHKKRMELQETENRLGVQVQGKLKEMEDLRKQEESRQQRILRAKEELEAAEFELQSLPAYEHPKDEIERLRAQILELEASASQKRLMKSEIEKNISQKRNNLRQCSDRLKDMENTNTKLLQALKNSGTEKIFEAYHWLQEHRHEFKKEVYGPVLLEVNVSNRTHADYLEGHIPSYVWKSFITQDSDDRDIMVKNLGSFGVPILNYVGGERRTNQHFELSEEVRAFGIYSRLDQIFEAPAAVKEVLTMQFGLEHSYIGSKVTDQKADEVSKLGILDFWTPDNHYRWSRSRYGGHMSGSVEPVDRSRLLLCNLDAGEIDGLRSRKNELEESVSALEENCKSCQNELRLIEDEEAKLRKHRENILNTVQHEKRKRREMENRIDQRKKKLESMEREEDLDTVVAKLVDQVANFNIQRFRCAIEIKHLLLEAVSYRQSLTKNHMSSIEIEAKIRELEVNLKQHEKVALQASVQFEYCKKEVEDYLQQLSAAKKYAESIAAITPELEKEFLEMPTTIEELEAAIQDNTSQANSILFLNHNVLEEYEHRQRQINIIARKLEADKHELRKCMAEVDDLKGNWLPTLRKLVSQINESFSRNFQEMAVAGEVLLDEHDMDFDQFGILIKVKFRQSGQLQVLSAHHQSGGERSVSTILYLVSLQDLTNCPFRVVDEINQGMDPINERKMFQQLVRAASQTNTPQCFLLTPKLLPELEYSEACTILNIMNGPWIEQPSRAWSNGDSWGTLMNYVGKSRC